MRIESVAVGGTIRLGQFLKLVDLADTGGLARELILDGRVSVNDEVERRRGRQLAPGDIVSLATGDQVFRARVG